MVTFVLLFASDRIVILLGGSDKKHQDSAIVRAHEGWASYKRAKTQPKKG